MRMRRVTMMATVALWVAAAANGADGPGEGVVGDTVWETVQRGGEVMYVILAASVLGLALVLEVLYRTRRGRILPGDVDRALSAGTLDVAGYLGGGAPSCVRDVLRAGYRWRSGSHEQIQAAVEEAVDEHLWQLKRAVRPVGIIANTTPLLGLLGTVIGIIQAFDAVARQGALGDPGALAGGISKALLTTCFGLIVAIPMLLIYHYLNGRVECLMRRCELLAKGQLILPPEADDRAREGAAGDGAAAEVSA